MVDEPGSVLHGGPRRSAPNWSLKEPAVVASVLGADYAHLGDEVASLTDAGVDRIQWAWHAGSELLVAGSVVLRHPGGKRTAVAELRRALARPVSAP